jgi:hypothetical protein
MNALGALEPFVRAWRNVAPSGEAAEQCGVCDYAIDDEQHDHLVDLEDRSLLCACAPCAALFAQQGILGASGQRYARVPTRVMVDPTFQLEDAQWNALAIPVRLAFLFYNSRLARWVALYPSPGGAAEAEPPADAFSALQTSTRLIGAIAPDVEGLMVYGRRAGKLESFLAPIDTCYRLVGEVRLHWQGINGGDQVWQRIEAFFAELRARATAFVPRGTA